MFGIDKIHKFFEREPPESGREPSRTSDQPILIEVVNAKLRI